MTEKSLPGVPLSGRIYKICTLLSTDIVENTSRPPKRALPAKPCWARPRRIGAIPRGMASMTGAWAPVRMERVCNLFMNKAHDCCSATKSAAARVQFSSPNHRGGRRTSKYGGQSGHSLSSGTQRVSAHRPCQIDLPEFRPGRRKRRRLPSALRRYQSGQGGRRVRGLDQGRRQVARFRLGTAPLPCLRLFRPPVRIRPPSDQGGLGVRRQLEPGRDARRCGAR